MAHSLTTKAHTLLQLGLGNVARVAWYRLRLRSGVHPVQRLAPRPAARAPFFSGSNAPDVETPRSIPSGAQFGWLPESDAVMPDWHRNPLNGARALGADAPWWTLPDFDAQLGDIKCIWEASRLDWAVRFAQQARVSDGAGTDRLNEWLADWSQRNPPFAGHNWKCAQEASIRVMHLAVAALILRETDAPEPGLRSLLLTHLERIAPTIAYAKAQDNNHGTSEAAALAIGGSWLERLGVEQGKQWHAMGRELLANRAERLVAPDGSFSQHSVNYHRLALDTLSLAEVWRRHIGAQDFPLVVRDRAIAAMEWLRALTDAHSGDAPNLGANDGANLLPLTGADYRDFRPSVQLASAVFTGRAAFPPGPWDDQLRWLDVAIPTELLSPVKSRLYPDGGFAVLRRSQVMALLRYPRFRFRPAHADALHLDLWLRGENVLRDGGSFSYGADEATQAYFTGAAGHNSVQLDDHEQMPRLGRFLWGDWLTPSVAKPVVESASVTTAGAAYRDRFGASHARHVELSSDSLLVRDEVRGISHHAVLRWRLRPGDWRVDGHAISDGQLRLVATADVPITRFEIVQGWESRYYLQRAAVPVLEVEITQAGNLTTACSWNE